MSRHTFTIEVEVDDAALAQHNQAGERDKDRTVIPGDPSEWGDGDLGIALAYELGELEIVDYRANLTPAEAYRVDREARR